MRSGYPSIGRRPAIATAGIAAMACAAALTLLVIGCSSDDDPPVASDPVVAPPVQPGTDPTAGNGRDQFLPPEPPSGYTPKPIVFANRDMVVAANPVAVQVGVDVLANGGKAIDAAIAVQAVLNLVEPQSSGIGGGAFLVYYDAATKSITTYDGRETAPASSTPERFLKPDGTPLGFLEAVDGGLSVGVPGLLRMLEMAHRAHGAKPWAGLFDPAIDLSDNGFAISPRLAVSIEGIRGRLSAQPAAAGYFLNADGSAKTAGTLLKNPDLAQTFRTIANEGAQAFYTGELASRIVAAVRNSPTRPGDMTVDDLAGYQAKERAPVCVVYRVSYRVCGMGMPSSGGATVGMTLKLLERFDLRALGGNSVDATHLMVEAYKLAYADRGVYMADSDFVPVPLEGLLDDAYLATRSALIDPATAMATPPAGVPPGATVAMGRDSSLQLPSTSHLSIVDRDGNVVSMTTTIENGFGSLQFVGGFLLNNQLTDFSFLPTDAGKPVANRVQAGKRPRSSMSPTIVVDDRSGEVEMAIGSPGGSAIIQYVAKTIVGAVDFQLDVQQAINLPNVGAGNTPNVRLEKGSVDVAAIKAGLEAKGHTVDDPRDATSGLHGFVFNGTRSDGSAGALARDPGRGTWAGGADPRREGLAKGND